MDTLYEQGVRNFAGIHDCWLVPAQVTTTWQGDESGLAVLERAIKTAAAAWYRGLGPVYTAMAAHVETRRSRALIEDAREKWRWRCATGWKPTFGYKDSTDGGV
jgi:hypothetical protein